MACFRAHIEDKEVEFSVGGKHADDDAEHVVEFAFLPRIVNSAGSFDETFVRVQPSSCLDEVRNASCTNPVLLVNGREVGPLAEHEHGQGGVVMRASNLQQVVRATPGAALMHPASRWGGIYAPRVMVAEDGSGQELDEPFPVAMVFAAATEMPFTQKDDPKALRKFRAEMWTKVLNVLRMCHEQHHVELVLGAWGCQRAPRAEVAAIFRAALFDSDLCGRFRQVTFACEDEGADYKIFRDVFNS